MAVEQRTSDYNQSGNPGPYLAQVVSHLDTKYMGTIEVELLSLTGTGNNTATTGQTVQVKYMSPFYGVTPFKDLTKNDTYAYTQKSYGFWAVPPDVGSIVMVIFVEGNRSNGYWIGCVQDELMNFMVPGYAATTFNSSNKGKSLPVGEYNKAVETGKGGDPTQYIKPANTDAIDQLTKAGLIDDPIRGITSSSARREVPSMVFGWSTPGPADRRPGAPKGKYGKEGGQRDFPTNRLGGSSFVMDDGDPNFLRKTPASAGPPVYASVEAGEKGDPTLPANELVRIRTRSGHQILLHNTEDLIYISHGSGNSWIEMTAGGRIDVYSSGGLNFHSDGDINLDAGGNVNIGAAGSINLGAPTTNANNVGVTGNLDASGTIKASTVSGVNVKATHPHLQPGGSAGSPTAPTPPGTVPGHEPWDGHENGTATLKDTFKKGK